MKVLLAGATGAIGRPLARMLHDAGHQVVALSRGGDQSRALVDPDVEPIVADALDLMRSCAPLAVCGWTRSSTS
ncbi:MAG TPA: NAD(P)H-binding protein [Microbacterium sp.]|nr:NAD(P)H-binding protein [Microbacterium sp.]HET6301808.1 NAD(P)H-binding protein [Microbacterium sp.]